MAGVAILVLCGWLRRALVVVVGLVGSIRDVTQLPLRQVPLEGAEQRAEGGSVHAQTTAQ